MKLTPLAFFFALALPKLAIAVEPADRAAADALFQAGKAALKAEQYAEACAKFEESDRLDPAIGTVLALAFCYEKANRIASAWTTYQDAESRAKKEGQKKREQAASAKVKELEARLPKLTINVAPEVAKLPGLSITRNGLAVGAGTFGAQIPVDPGAIEIRAIATGYHPLILKITLAMAERLEVLVPKLEPLPVAPPLPQVKVEPPAPPIVAHTEPEPDSGINGLLIGGVAASGAGLVAIGVSVFFGISAANNNDRSKADCVENICGPEGFAFRSDARKEGDLATITLVTGGALGTLGVVLLVLALGGDSQG